MHARPFKQVDVFTATPYFGNALAVVLDGSGLGDEAMQRFAAWTNLSETTFLLPPTHAGRAAGADYQVRIFTPGGELPFAGHPTLGSCHAWLEAGGVAQQPEEVAQECAVGLVRIRRHSGHLSFAAPPLQRSVPDAALLQKVLAALGLGSDQVIAAQMLNNGPVWLGLLLDSVDTVLQLQPDHGVLKELGQKVGVAGIEPRQDASLLIAHGNREARAFQREAHEFAAPTLEVRGFAAPLGINEDPVTGSLNASLAQWLIAEGHLPEHYVAAQGQCLGRAGHVAIERDAQGQVWVGGHCVTCIEGNVML